MLDIEPKTRIKKKTVRQEVKANHKKYSKRWIQGMEKYFDSLDWFWCECGKLVTRPMAKNQRHCSRSCRNRAYYLRRRAKLGKVKWN
jgi:hypothetical protein